MGGPKKVPYEHGHLWGRVTSGAPCQQRRNLSCSAVGMLCGSRVHRSRPQVVVGLAKATRPWPLLALLLFTCQELIVCGAVNRQKDTGLPSSQHLLEDQVTEWDAPLGSPQLEESECDDVELPVDEGQEAHDRHLEELPGQGAPHRQLRATGRGRRRQWHMLSLPECEVFRRRLLAAANSSSGHERWPRGGYKRWGSQCWSHAEWYCFAGLPFKSRPSPRLLSLLHLYRARARECSVQDGPRNWEGLRGALERGAPSHCRYLLWSPTEDGLGNQMLSLVSAFVYSLLTFRVLLVEPLPSSVSHLFCEPFLRTPSWRFPHVDQFGGRRGFTSGPFIKNYSYLLSDAFELRKPPPNVLPFHVHLWSDMQPLFCPETHHWAAGASALVVSSNLYWLPGLYFVPHFRRKLEALFPSRRAFATLAPLILHPSNRVWAQATSFLLRHTPPPSINPGSAGTERGQYEEGGGAPGAPAAPLRVGLQFRAKFGIPVAEAVNGSVACLRRLPHLLHRGPSWPVSASLLERYPVGASQLPQEGSPGEGGPGTHVGRGVSEGESQDGSGGGSGARFTLLLASLDQDFKEGVVAQLGDRTEEGGGLQVGEVMSLTSDTGQRFGDLEHNERALVEILSVALSSQVVLVTPRSTFGYTIAALSSGVPFFITPCEPAMREPCFLRPATNVRCKYSRFRVEGGHIRGVKQPILRSCPDAMWLHRHWEKQPSTGVAAIDTDV